LRKYQIQDQVPTTVYQFLTSPSLSLAAIAAPHASRRDGAPSISGQVQNIIIGDNKLAAQAAMHEAEREGFYTEILTNELQGEARDAGYMLAHQLRVNISERPHPFCLIAGGETTVTLKGKGKGGRNQELALAAVKELAGLRDAMLISLAT